MGAESSIPQHAANDRASTPPLSPLLEPDKALNEFARKPSTMPQPPADATEMLDRSLSASPTLESRKRSKKKRTVGKTKGSNLNFKPDVDGKLESPARNATPAGNQESTGPVKKKKKEKKKKRHAKLNNESLDREPDSSRMPETAVQLDGFPLASSQSDTKGARIAVFAGPTAPPRKKQKRSETKATEELVAPVQDASGSSEGVVIPSSPRVKKRYSNADSPQSYERRKPLKAFRNQKHDLVDAAEDVQPTTSPVGSEYGDIVQDTQERSIPALESRLGEPRQVEEEVEPEAKSSTFDPRLRRRSDGNGPSDVSGPSGGEAETGLEDVSSFTGVHDTTDNYVETSIPDEERSPPSIENIDGNDISGSRNTPQRGLPPTGRRLRPRHTSDSRPGEVQSGIGKPGLAAVSSPARTGTNRSRGTRSRDRGLNEGVMAADAVLARSSTPEKPLTARGYDRVPTSTPHTATNRSQNKRLPKPSFYDRPLEDDVQHISTTHFAEEETSASPMRKKRRLSFEVSGNTESSSPRTSAKGQSEEPIRKTRFKQSRTPNTTVRNVADQDEGVLTIRSEYRQGPLTRLEIEQVTRAVEQFRSDHRLQKNDINNLIQENPKGGKPIHLGLWRQVQSACPTRPRRKLIQWSRLHFHNFPARGTWTEEQDGELREMVKIHGKRWSLIGGIINRHPTDARDRWRNYLTCDDRKTSGWSDEEQERLLNIVSASLLSIQNTREEDPDGTSFKPDEHMLDWGYVSEKMGFTRTRLQCQEKWKRLRRVSQEAKRLSSNPPQGSPRQEQQSRNDADAVSTSTKRLLVTEIYKSGAIRDPDIPWTLLVRAFDGRFQRRTLVDLWASLRQLVPGFKTASTDHCARYLIEEYEGGNGSFGEEESDHMPLRRSNAARSSTSASRARPPHSSLRTNEDGRGGNLGSELVPESGPEDEIDGHGGAGWVDPAEGSNSLSHPITPLGRSLPVGSDDKTPDSGRSMRDGSVDLSTDFQGEPDQGTPMPAKIGGGEILTTQASRKRATGLVVELGVGRETRKRKKQKRAPTSAPDPDPDPEPEEDGRSTNEEPDSALSSNMSDMDDIPARLPVASEDEHLDEEF